MKRNKDAYSNYVCPHCWNKLLECTCRFFPPYSLVFIDKNIQECIKILNNKRYCTVGCCEGHREVCISTYIAFAESYDINDTLPVPEGFKYNKNKRMVYFDYSPRLSDKEMENLKKEKLKVLLEWCKNLPDRHRRV